MNAITNSQDRNTLRLTRAGFDGVEFALYKNGDAYPARQVLVTVVSGTSWGKSVRFPTMQSEATASTGDDYLDREVRERAAEELVRLDAATLALRAAA